MTYVLNADPGKTGQWSPWDGQSGGSGPSGKLGLIGATIFPPAYPQAGGRVAAGQYFDSLLAQANPQVSWGAAMLAQKQYLDPGTFVDTADPTCNTPQPIGDVARAGAWQLISFKPSIAMTPADLHSLQTSIGFLQDNGVGDFSVLLWNEANDQSPNGGSNWFASTSDPTGANTYHEYIGYYGPAVTAMGVPLGYCAFWAGSGPGTAAVNFFPGAQYVSQVYVDIYTQQFADVPDPTKGVPGNPAGAGMGATNLSNFLTQVVEASGLDFGVAEFGYASNPSSPTQQAYTDFLAYLNGILTSRYVAGKTNLPSMWYANGPVNAFTTAADFRAVGLADLSNACCSLSPSPAV